MNKDLLWNTVIEVTPPFKIDRSSPAFYTFSGSYSPPQLSFLIDKLGNKSDWNFSEMSIRNTS